MQDAEANITSAVIMRWICILSLFLFAAGSVFGEGAYQRTKDGKTIVWNDNPRPGDTATWFGDRDAEGYAIRVGTLTWYTARGTVYARFRGNMVRGKFNGMVNGHSKGKSGHSLFVNGHRTTPWVAGTSNSAEIAQAQTPPAKTPEKEAKPENIVSATAERAAPNHQVSRENNQPAAERLLKKVASEDDRQKTRPTAITIEPNPLPQNFEPNVGIASGTGQALSQAATNEIASQQTPSSAPVAATEESSAKEEPKNTEPEAPAEGPRIESTGEPPATASPSLPAPQGIGEKPSAPEDAAANGPATGEKRVQPDHSMSGATPPKPKREEAVSRQSNRALTTEEVIMLANSELRKHGYDRAQFVRQQPQFNADRGVWSVVYDPMTFDGMKTAGEHFDVVIDDRTKGAVFLPQK